MRTCQSILHSKLTKPYTARSLQRPRLQKQLQAITYKKLALIIAGAGYGKSTLVAQTMEGLDAHVIWYNLDPSDGDLSTFMAHLLDGAQKHDPDFGADFWPKLSVPLVSRESRQKLLASFIIEVQKHFSHPMFIVLDDYYLIQENLEILDAIEFMLNQMPKTLHLVIISRKEPDLKISHYRATTDIIELNEADLAFNCDEIKRLYRDLLDVRINSPQIDDIYMKTGGWAAALLLLFNATKGCLSKAACDDLIDIGKPRKFIFEYLEENIVEHQPNEIQDFMMHSSLLSYLDPEICDAVCDTRDSHKILTNLSNNHLLTFPCTESGDCFQYHLLLKEFLRNRLIRQHGPKTVRKYHHRIARTMEDRWDIQSALRHYIAGEHYQEACRLLAGLVLIDFKDIPIVFLKQIFDKMPPALISKNARMLFIRAKVMSIGGEIRRALHQFQTAQTLFGKDADGIASCLKEIGFHHYLTGNLAMAVKALEPLRNRPHRDPFFQLEVSGLLILFSSIAGNVDKADGYYNCAMKKFAVSDTFDPEFIRAWLRLCYAYRYHVTGNFRKADTMNQQALHTFLQMELDNFLPITYFQTALTAYYLAEPEQGCDYAQKGLLVAAKQGVYDNQYAWLLYARALNRLGLGIDDQARSDAEACLDLFTAYENAWGQALAFECLGMIHGRNGDWETAVDAYENGLKILQTSDLKESPTHCSLSLGLAEVLLDNDRPAQASQIHYRYIDNIRISQFNLFRFHLLRARCENENAGPEQAMPDLETALSIVRNNGYEKWLTPQFQWLTPLLVECHHRNKYSDFIERLFINTGRESDTALFLLKNNPGHLGRAADRLLKAIPHKVPAPMNIYCLGSFSVTIGDQLIPKQQWRSGKATLLFKALVIQYEWGWIPKETLLELAWPGEDPAITSPRLHVALNSLRKLFEPDLKRGVPSAYILRNSDGYRLEIGKEGSIDFLEFQKAVDEASAIDASETELSLALGLKAISLYRGALLEENPYDEWLMKYRESLRAKYLRCLSGIIRLYEKQEAWYQCIEFCETYLLHDEFAEPIYRKLMVMHSKVGNLSQVTQTFEKCKSNINDGLDCPLSDVTLKLYEKLNNQSL